VKTGLFGGAFDPPHLGHVALARAAIRHFGLDRLLVLVVEHPGHKEVQTEPETRLRLAEAAFADVPEAEVRLEPSARTVDSLRDDRYGDAIFLIGADQFAGFAGWKEPDDLLEHVRLGVATRPGVPRERLDEVLAGLRRPHRVEFFELEPVDVSSRELRRRAAAGEPIDPFVPPGVADLVRSRGLYRHDVGLH
jgi:nicotinate-nucleotide adenylyltransferase